MKNLTEMTVTELKALAYDLLVQRQTIEANLTAVNQAIAEKVQQDSTKEHGTPQT